MNEEKTNSLRNNTVESSSENINTSYSAGPSNIQDAQQVPNQKYESFFVFFFSSASMFLTRLVKDLYRSGLNYLYAEQVLPSHIADLLTVHKNLRTERESTSSQGISEDDITIVPRVKVNKPINVDRERQFVIIESQSANNTRCLETVEKKAPLYRTVLKKHFSKLDQNYDKPCSTKDLRSDVIPLLRDSESRNELQMLDINLQSNDSLQIPNESSIDFNEKNSIMLRYLRSKGLLKRQEATLIPSHRKESLLINVHKMATITECEHSLSIRSSSSILSSHESFERVSENSLDAYIPSLPASPRFTILLNSSSEGSVSSEMMNEHRETVTNAAKLFHKDNIFLDAAENGDIDTLLEEIRNIRTDTQQLDQLGRNALHLAVESGCVEAVEILLDANVDPNVMDDLCMTPLTVCLTKRSIMPDAFLMKFIDYIMMCQPTKEEEGIIKLLVKMGALVNDPELPAGRQPLHFAAMDDNCKMIEILCKLGADIFYTDHKNRTALDVAVAFSCRRAENLLLMLEEEFYDKMHHASIEKAS